MSDVRDTLVFAVGISSYDLGDSWRLPNAAEQALEFASWARGRGVPADRIHLFLSRADEQRLRPRLAKTGLSARPATFGVVTEFALQELTTIAGDLLYIFWSGHGSMSEDGRRVLFFENASLAAQLPFDLNDFFDTLRSLSYQRFARQIAFIDACANRFEELGFDASVGQVTAGKGRRSHEGVKQAFFLAADSGEQAKEGAFGAAVLEALADATRAQPAAWPVNQDAIVATVRPQFEGPGQHPVQLVWTTAEGDVIGVERASAELPASRFVNAAAAWRKLPVHAVRRLADIALSYAQLGEDSAFGALQRDTLYASLCVATARSASPLRRNSPRIEMLHVVGAALQWNQEDRLAADLGQLAPVAEFVGELQRIALIQRVRDLVERLPGKADDIRAEYHKTISRLAYEPARAQASTIDAMLDELYQISAAGDPQRPVWEFLLRLAARFPNDRGPIDTFIADHRVAPLTLQTLQDELNAERQFVLSINLYPADTLKPAIKEIRALLVVEGTSNVKHRFEPVPVTTWDSLEESASRIIHKAREIVMTTYGRGDGALLVEFLMPAPFLQHAAESLPLLIGGRQRALGVLHPVVVRLRERSAERNLAINLDEWEKVGKRIDRDRPGTVHWMDSSRATPTIDACEGIVVLQFLPGDEVIDIVDEGYPFMAWLRGEPGGGWPEFVESFEVWAKGSPLRALARNVRAIRKSAPTREVGLTLFWDDPEQTRYWFQLDDVSLGGHQ